MHGGRFRSRDQMLSAYGCNLVESLLQVQMFFLNSIGDQTNDLHQNLNSFCPQIRLKTKKKSLNRNLVLQYVNSAGIRDLLVLPITFLSHRPGAYS